MSTIGIAYEKKTGGGHINSIVGGGFYKSPFVEYVVENENYSDLFEFIHVDNLEEATSEIILLPIGAYVNFDTVSAAELYKNQEFFRRVYGLLHKMLRDPRAYVLINLSWECTHIQYLSYIPKFAQLVDFPVDRIVFLGNNSATTIMSDKAQVYGYTAVGAWFFEFYTHIMHQKEMTEIGDFPLASLQRSRMYISLNRRVRRHRVLLASYLQARGLLERGHFSFGGKDAAEIDNAHIRQNEINAALTLAMQLHNRTDIDQSLGHILNNEPYVLDVNFQAAYSDRGIFNEKVLSTGNDIKNYFRDSHFAIITETDFGTSDYDFLLTEKTYKAILLGVPFIVLSGPYSLAALRMSGYETYDSVIDERYDTIRSPQHRFAAAMNSIEETVAKIDLDANAYINAIIPIAQRNQARFIALVPQKIRNFVEELKDRIKRAETAGYRSFPGMLSDGALSGDLGEVIPARFDDGFYQFEVAFGGRWCREQGVLTIWAESGIWELTLLINKMPPDHAPTFYINDRRTVPTFSMTEDRLEVKFQAEARGGFFTVKIVPRSTFIPGLDQPGTADYRSLGAYVFNMGKLRRL
ncbi:hypothetical protein UAJ10_08305 [Nitrospirillum sp. BR 11164]|uniref:hypothetical protein n=1 Tax=Nitrospirillum sp. BR 11164 TaxID=3104324 RepID=UPI002AFFE5A5|nr:hypothetical protein [Nitrospirillum sp. BR 11164]MEA1649021.1 hypothetical protein [Nitrospirillum sp. BR 11164]